MTRTTFRSYRLKIWLPLSSFLPFIGLLSGVVGLDYHNTRAVDAPAYRSGRPGFFKTAAVKKISENDPSVKNPLSGEGELTRLGRILEQNHQVLQHTLKVLKQREQLLAVTLQAIGNGLITTGRQGSITGMNPIAEQLTG